MRLPLSGMLTLVALAAACSAPPPVVGAPPPVSTSEGSPVPATPAPPVVAPSKLSIPILNLNATVDAVGVDANGDFLVPPSVDHIGWYKWGPGANATAGSIVIAGHVDSAAQGKGAFFRLRDLEPGDRLTLTASDGSVREFSVVSREQYDKQKIPLERYFARDGQPRLTLITCGGPFDRRTRHYRDNVVVTALPA